MNSPRNGWFYINKPGLVRGLGLTPVRIRRIGFCLWTSHAVRENKRGTIHFVSAVQFRMTACGANSKSRPLDVTRVGRQRITCLRCLTIVLLQLNRDGLLARSARQEAA